MLCVVALAASQLDRRFGVLCLLLIYGLSYREWRRLSHRHPRAVIALTHQGAQSWVLHDAAGGHHTVRWLPSSVVTQHGMLLHGIDQARRRHALLLMRDSVCPGEWRPLVVAVRLDAWQSTRRLLT